MTGYTVVDLETTGLFPRKHDRVVEIGVVSVSEDGVVEGEWSTLIDPQRDVGPTHIHGITAREIRGAPTFAEIAGHVIGLLAGRTLVAHNARFDTQFLDHEFSRAKSGTLPPTPSLCTMELSSSFLRGASRKLRDCCAAARVHHADEHSALGDARATSGLLRYYLASCGVPVPWHATTVEANGHWWPTQAAGRRTPRTLTRSGAVRPADAWLERISGDLPRNPDPMVEAYLAVLERAMLDGYLSAHEEDALIGVAADLGMHRDQVSAVHATFLDAMAIAAWEDGVVTDAETAELHGVAAMLGLPASLVGLSLRRASQLLRPALRETRFRLSTGDKVAFTGALSVPRDQLELLSAQAGLRPGSVTKDTRVVVAADPDSASGKAAKARAYGVPVITEAAFARLLGDLS